MATPRTAAGALLRSPAGQVLLVKPTYKDGWEIPGGYVEPGESPAAACARELVEEIGLARETGPLLVIDWAPHPSDGDRLLLVFDGGVLADRDVAALHPDGVEITEARFFEPDDLDGHVPARLARRLALAIQAVREDRTIYAEHGTEPGTPGATART